MTVNLGRTRRWGGREGAVERAKAALAKRGERKLITDDAKRIRRSPSLAGAWWSATVLQHMAADDACGREWSCCCGACRAAVETGRFGRDAAKGAK